MKRSMLNGLCVALLTIVGLLFSAERSTAATKSETLPVLRITLQGTSSALVEYGHLLNNGTFQVTGSETRDLSYYLYSQMLPVAGRVIMEWAPYVDSLSVGWINNWVASDKTYQIFAQLFVIVCVKGVCDPNNVPDLSLPNLTLSALPTPVNFRQYNDPVVANYDNESRIIYDNEDIKLSWYVINAGGSSTGEFDISVYVDGVYDGKLRSYGLSSGSPDGLMYDVANLGHLTAGRHAIKVVVDSSNEVKEWKEDDNSFTLSVDVLAGYVPPVITTLRNYVTVTGIEGTAGGMKLFKIVVPPGMTELDVGTVGGTGNCDLYVSFGIKPDIAMMIPRSVGSDNSESVLISNPLAGDYYIGLYGTAAFSQVSLTAGSSNLRDMASLTAGVCENITEVRPTYGKNIEKQAGKDSLVVITHGWNPKPFNPIKPADAGWIDQMADLIGKSLTANGLNNWQVHAYNWVDKAWTASPQTALNHGTMEGTALGSRLAYQGWKHIHFIGHSAGAALIQAAAEQIGAPTKVHLTFLDPYVGIDSYGVRRYGDGATWADNYFSRDPETFGGLSSLTQGCLSKAYNVDVTWLDPDKRQVGMFNLPATGAPGECYETITSHGWSVLFYDTTVTTPGWRDAKGFGFALSRESKNPAFTFDNYRVGNNPSKVLGNPDPSCAKWLLPDTVWDALRNLGKSMIYRSPTGVSYISDDEITLTTGSPVWIVVGVTNSANALAFDAWFSESGDGLLRVFWDGDQLGTIDGPALGSNGRHFAYQFDCPEKASHTLGFRLDGYALGSQVMLSNIKLATTGPAGAVSLEFTGKTADGFPILSLVGPPGFSYIVEASENLIDWTMVAGLVNTTGSVSFVDRTSATAGHRFYQALSP